MDKKIKVNISDQLTPRVLEPILVDVGAIGGVYLSTAEATDLAKDLSEAVIKVHDRQAKITKIKDMAAYAQDIVTFCDDLLEYLAGDDESQYDSTMRDIDANIRDLEQIHGELED